jgi:hypothetical protein
MAEKLKHQSAGAMSSQPKPSPPLGRQRRRRSGEDHHGRAVAEGDGDRCRWRVLRLPRRDTPHLEQTKGSIVSTDSGSGKGRRLVDESLQRHEGRRRPISRAHASSVCWYSCWYCSNMKTKMILSSTGYGIKRLSARGRSRQRKRKRIQAAGSRLVRLESNRRRAGIELQCLAAIAHLPNRALASAPVSHQK